MTLPTVYTEIVFITSTIDAFEGKTVETMDVPSDFLHTSMDPKNTNIHMALRVKMAELTVNIDHKLYRKFLSTFNKGCMILYLEMQKDLYGMLKPLLMFYLKLLWDLTRAGFTLNQYDLFLMNKIVGGESR